MMTIIKRICMPQKNTTVFINGAHRGIALLAARAAGAVGLRKGFAHV
jgi:hypothetical protein